MAKKSKNKKKHPIVPKKKERMKQARSWIKSYTGAKIVKAYREKFRVDVACAIRELQELGYKFKDGYVDAALRSEELRIHQVQAKKAEKAQDDYDDFQDDRFAYIAGYTSGGAPYGITWEEMRDKGLLPYEEELENEIAELEDELFELGADEYM